MSAARAGAVARRAARAGRALLLGLGVAGPLVGCRHPAAPGGAPPEAAEPPRAAPPPAPPPPPPTGVVLDGVWVDAVHPLRVVLPAGWSARPAAEGGDLRATFTHAPTGTVVEVHVAPDEAPLTRAGCTWRFEDRSPYRLAGRDGPVTAASCWSEDPAAPRVTSWSFAEGAVTWELVVLTPRGLLEESNEAVRGLLLGSDWDG